MATVVQGADKLRSKLKRIPVSARIEIAKAMETSAEEVVKLARSLVPVDQGDLRDSIGWSWHGAPEGSIRIGRVKTRTDGRGGNMAIVIYAGDDKAFYARWVEFGTRTQMAQPYFFPVWRAMRKRARSRVSRAMNKAIKRIASGG